MLMHNYRWKEYFFEYKTFLSRIRLNNLKRFDKLSNVKLGHFKQLEIDQTSWTKFLLKSTRQEASIIINP